MNETIRVAGVQTDVVLADRARNLQCVLAKFESCVSAGAQLVVFPECMLSGYCYDSLAEAREQAEPIPGPATGAVAAACRRFDAHCIFGMLEADGDRLFNACVLVGPAGVVGVYRKIHLPYLGVDRFVTPGDRPFDVHDIGTARIGMNICYDGAFPEAARVMALEGADLIVLPTNWPPGAQATADYVVNARALENCVFYLAVDRVGAERGFAFIGKSKICDVHGMVLDQADHAEEAIVAAELDLSQARCKRIVRVPDKHIIDRFADRRPEKYGRITEPNAADSA